MAFFIPKSLVLFLTGLTYFCYVTEMDMVIYRGNSQHRAKFRNFDKSKKAFNYRKES